ncbi:MAG TPA: glycosyltransferase family 9 protein [Casimicrobiaceae bacterium]|nr:glycosyltransferase family 9 protein [Casimicrobiaceae bacterium]
MPVEPERQRAGRSERHRSPGAAPHAEVIAKAAAHANAGRLGQSLALLNEQLVRHPIAAELLYARALTLLEWGRLREAMEDLGAAEVHGLSSFGLHLNFAQVCYAFGHAEEAERRLRLALALDESVAAAHIGLGTVLRDAKRFDEAIRNYERAFELAPERVDCLWQIADCKLGKKEAVAAETIVRGAIALHGDDVRPWGILAAALAMQERLGEALDAFEYAEQVEHRMGRPHETFVAHAGQLLGLGRLNEALGLYARYLASTTDSGAHADCGFVLLAAGYLRDGWPLYEFEWCNPNLAPSRSRFGRPEWRGQNLRGKTLLLWADRGVGDIVQFVRFSRDLMAKGASVVLQVRPSLREFAADCFGLDRVIESESELIGGFDYYIHAMSVPGALGIDLASIPAQVPYLTIPPEHRNRWQKRIASDAFLNVGLVWASNPDNVRLQFRSMRLAQLEPLFDVEGVQFYSLQKERRPEDLAHLAADGKLIDLAPELDDFRDTAAAIAALDLVVSVDTAVAHIAGALAKPVWTMLSAVPDCRWLTAREDTPWYPTMHLFRQQRQGDWGEVVTRIQTALRDAVRARRADDQSTLVIDAKRTGRPMDSTSNMTHGVPISQLCRVNDTRYGFIQYTPREQPLADSLQWFGEWLQPQIDLLAKLLTSGGIVVEGGSGIGAHALALARIIGPSGHLLAYEPDSMLAQLLSNNLRSNGVINVTIMRRILGGPPRDGDGARANGSEGGLLVTDTIDDLLLKRLDLIKLNKSSDALEILNGATETLWRLRPVVFLSVEAESTLAELADHMKMFGYRCWQMATPSLVPTNYNCREDDIAAGFTALAVVAVPEEAESHLPLQSLAEV